MFARFATRPAEPSLFIPSFPPIDSSGLPKVRVIHSTIGNAPINTQEICPQVRRPDSSGIAPEASGSTMMFRSGNLIPVSYSNTAIAVKIVITIVTPEPNLSKPRIILSGITHRPTTIRPAIMITGIRFTRIVPIPILYCVMFIARPPTIHPIGTVIRPARTPAPRYGLSDFLIMESATGIVNTIVGPIMVPRIRPAKLPTLSFAAICIASG